MNELMYVILSGGFNSKRDILSNLIYNYYLHYHYITIFVLAYHVIILLTIHYIEYYFKPVFVRDSLSFM